MANDRMATLYTRPEPALTSLVRTWRFEHSDGSIVPFDQARMVASIGQAFEAVAGTMDPDRLAQRASTIAELAILNLSHRMHGSQYVSAVSVQDQVQLVLYSSEEYAVARAYGITQAAFPVARPGRPCGHVTWP